MGSRLTLTARLTLLFTVGSAVVLLAFGALVMAAIASHFDELDRDELAGKLDYAAQLVATMDRPLSKEAVAKELASSFAGHHELVMQVRGPSGMVWFASPGVEFPVSLVTAPHLSHWRSGGRTFHGLEKTLLVGATAGGALTLVLALDTAHHERFLQSFRVTLWLFVACAVMFMGLLGWVSARRGLAPLRAMRERAATVTAHSLDRRLPVQAVPPELAELAITLNEMLERLEDAFKRLSDFSADLAHELRTPVSNLMVQTQVALSLPRDAEGYRAILESNAEEYERLARMISDMLFLAKAENGLVLVHEELVDVAHEVRQLFDFYELSADEKRIDLQLRGEGALRGDRLMLRRALGNLISNALRHTPVGGTISVAIDQDAARLRIQVQNTGEPIAAAHLARFFERFYRADPARQHEAGEGIGLGLSISQAIAHAHGGEVAAASNDGLTIFSLTFPNSR
ncbi:heavy metal sensor histidine kinase [Simplicispira suum]|uniref:Sensor protein n=1 Tax=Simplicispira suum TaxID=2109915 RepID=A0A2S0N0P4_9BURK|nr:heavy metal sensor histidine kinase [Simplicispira suum]AVO41708.1 two-component sensor histidine kinase [Simplicispira suum]